MEPIGLKIRRIRKEKQLSQDYINPSPGNSRIAQIENNPKRKPNRDLLDFVAGKFEMTYDDLINGTDYNESFVSNSGYAISEVDFDLEVHDRYNFSLVRAIYQREEKYKGTNIYCPKTGTPLIHDCRNCKRRIDMPDITFCMSCGELLFYDFYNLNKSGDWGHSQELKKIWENEKERKSYINGCAYYFWMDYDDISEDYIDAVNLHQDVYGIGLGVNERSEGKGYTKLPKKTKGMSNDEYLKKMRDNGFYNLKEFMTPEEYWDEQVKRDRENVMYAIKGIFGMENSKFYSKNNEKWTVEDWILGSKSKIPELSHFFTQWSSKLNFIIEYSKQVDQILIKEKHLSQIEKKS